MKRINFFTAIFFIAVMFFGTSYAGDKEDVEAFIDETINAFNSKQETYLSSVSDDMQAFNSIIKTLIFEDKTEWENWIRSLWDLPYVNYQQQHNSVRVYNGNAAVVNGYYTFTTIAKDGNSSTISGRATISLVKMDGKWMVVNYHFSKFF